MQTQWFDIVFLERVGDLKPIFYFVHYNQGDYDDLSRKSYFGIYAR